MACACQCIEVYHGMLHACQRVALYGKRLVEDTPFKTLYKVVVHMRIVRSKVDADIVMRG